MGEDQGAVHPQGKGVVDLVDGKAHHQGGTPLSAGHGVAHIVGIAHGDTIEQHRLSAGRGPQGHQLVAVVHVGQENLLVLHRHILAIEDLGLSLDAVERQVDKAPVRGRSLEPLSGRLIQGGHALRWYCLDDPPHLNQAHIHHCLKMALNLGAHTLHIGIHHPVQGRVVLPDHKAGNRRKHADAQGQKTDKTDP